MKKKINNQGINLFIKKGNDLLMKKEKRKFEIDEDNRDAVNFFLAYFFKKGYYEEFNVNPNKGIYIHGDFGTGKSLLFQILEEVYNEIRKNELRIKTVNSVNLVDKFWVEISNPNLLKQNNCSLLQKMSRGVIHFDDVGAERKINHFGNSIEIISDIIQSRYFNSKNNSKIKTFITSNFSCEQIGERYGRRIYDRLFEMFNIIEIGGESRRR